MSGQMDTTRRTWHDMLRRCEDPKDWAWKHYGGRGIKVCKRWHRFSNFLKDMGTRPKGLTLDRFPNNDGDYKPSNCRWATWSQQHRNRRSNKMITFRGKTMTMWDWAEKVGIDPFTLSSRLRKGWSVEEALAIPHERSSGKVIRRSLWRVAGDASHESLTRGRIEIRKACALRYRKANPEKFRKPKKIRTKCRHCDNPPQPGTSLCWGHSYKNPVYRRAYMVKWLSKRKTA